MSCWIDSENGVLSYGQGGYLAPTVDYVSFWIDSEYGVLGYGQGGYLAPTVDYVSCWIDSEYSVLGSVIFFYNTVFLLYRNYFKTFFSQDFFL